MWMPQFFCMRFGYHLVFCLFWVLFYFVWFCCCIGFLLAFLTKKLKLGRQGVGEDMEGFRVVKEYDPNIFKFKSSFE